MAHAYGWFGCHLADRRLVTCLERDTVTATFLMDGIFAAEAARGLGAGTLQLNAIPDAARRRNISSEKMDVIASNPRARAL